MPWETLSNDGSDEQESEEDDDEFESGPSIERLEFYEDLQRATLRVLEKAQGERTSKLERRAARLKNMIDELHAELNVTTHRVKK